jgi:hypothetical protein
MRAGTIALVMIPVLLKTAFGPTLGGHLATAACLNASMIGRITVSFGFI